MKKDDAEMLDEFSQYILDCVKKYEHFPIDVIRRGFGVCLSSVHGAMLQLDKNNAGKCIDSISRLSQSLDNNFKRFNVNANVEFYESFQEKDPKDNLQ